MNTNLSCLIAACEELGLRYRTHHPSANVVAVDTGRREALFANWTTPFNPQSVARLCRDKDFSFALLEDLAVTPHTLSFLNPEVDERYRRYLEHFTVGEIVAAIEERFELPVIVKRNSGTAGRNVFLCRTRSEIEQAVTAIFDRNSHGYDYVALAQRYVEPVKEYRVIVFEDTLQFAYHKSTRGATFTGNLSPLHWENARAVHEHEPDLLATLGRFSRPITERLQLAYGGLDVIVDRKDRLWLIEANSAPSFAVYVRDNGPEAVVGLYKTMLRRAAAL